MSSGPLSVASVQLAETLPAQGDVAALEEGKWPDYGVGLLCASGPREPAKAPLDETYTMFTGGLLEVLRNGDRREPRWLSLDDAQRLVRRRLNDRFSDKAVLPVVHAPQQRKGRVDLVPLFDNQARKAEFTQTEEDTFTDKRKQVEQTRNLAEMALTQNSAADLPKFSREDAFVLAGLELRRKNALEAAVLEACSSFASKIPTEGAIPPKKLKNARTALQVLPSDRVIGLIDTSFWGSNKTGIAFTSSGIYFKNKNDDPPDHIDWHDVLDWGRHNETCSLLSLKILGKKIDIGGGFRSEDLMTFIIRFSFMYGNRK